MHELGSTGLQTVTRDELIELAAVDNELFTRTFFPRTVRQATPWFHDDIWRKMESHNRLVSLQVFRGGAKTSLARMYTMKRISYALARTILYISKSEPHSIRSINWIKKHIEENRLLTETYHLSKGDKWQDLEAEIKHEAFAQPIWIMGMGMTGSVRGINREDFRPDLIVCDDIIDDENATSPDQRLKVEERLYGAIIESLAPASESPDAKLIMLQTPIHRDDASCKTEFDPAWSFTRYGIWTPETANRPIHEQESIWPDRWSSETVREEKRAAIARNKLSVFTREKECRITVPELASFLPTWLNFYEGSAPEYGIRTLVIDPVPPPSDKQIEQGLENKDYEAISVVQRTGNDFYLLEYAVHRGHDPSWTVAETFRLAEKWRPRKILVESVAYQRTLKWLIQRAMEVRRQWWNVQETPDATKSKFVKITNGLNGIASAGHLWVKKEHAEFIQQFTDYPRVSNDDVIETVAIACTDLQSPGSDEEALGGGLSNDEDDYKLLEYGGCP